MASDLTNVYVCSYGHMSEAGDELDASVARRDPPEFDYTKRCRRYGWVDQGKATATMLINGAAIVEEGRAMRSERCGRPVLPVADLPEAYAAFLLGGEDASRAIVVRLPERFKEIADGQALTGQGQGVRAASSERVQEAVEGGDSPPIAPSPPPVRAGRGRRGPSAR